ncbi:MAG TPA: FAD-dependent monooxygenase [Pseudonocardiaceae bacterium]|jgi:2-polyprenyl-6-methoxyphenol hydroxylase-like FAD-dependent oxidoreductase
MNRSVLISGAGVAGPSLAYWLGRTGYAVTVVERAPALRTGGAGPVDFRGDQLALLARMGVLGDIEAHQTGMGDQVVVDSDGRRLATFPSALFSGDVEIERPDLARILHQHSADVAEYVFGDHVTAMTETADAVTVTFANGPTRDFDLVVGADGLHSAVRGLTFGDERLFRHDLGLCIAGFTMPNGFGIDHGGLIYNEPGRMVMVSSGRNSALASVGLLFATTVPDHDRRDVDGQKRVLAEHFTDLGWQMPAVLDALRHTQELYFDTIGQIRLDRWSSGRVALLGDAAWCTGPGGNGTGHAMLGAYTLAGELALADGDHRVAYQRYEQLMRPVVTKSQKTAAGAGNFLTPATERKIRNRNLMFRFLSARALAGPFGWLAKRTANTGALRDYPLPRADRTSARLA